MSSLQSCAVSQTAAQTFHPGLVMVMQMSEVGDTPVAALAGEGVPCPDCAIIMTGPLPIPCLLKHGRALLKVMQIG